MKQRDDAPSAVELVQTVRADGEILQFGDRDDPDPGGVEREPGDAGGPARV